MSALWIALAILAVAPVAGVLGEIHGRQRRQSAIPAIPTACGQRVSLGGQECYIVEITRSTDGTASIRLLERDVYLAERFV